MEEAYRPAANVQNASTRTYFTPRNIVGTLSTTAFLTSVVAGAAFGFLFASSFFPGTAVAQFGFFKLGLIGVITSTVCAGGSAVPILYLLCTRAKNATHQVQLEGTEEPEESGGADGAGETDGEDGAGGASEEDETQQSSSETSSDDTLSEKNNYHSDPEKPKEKEHTTLPRRKSQGDFALISTSPQTDNECGSCCDEHRKARAQYVKTLRQTLERDGVKQSSGESRPDKLTRNIRDYNIASDTFSDEEEDIDDEAGLIVAKRDTQSEPSEDDVGEQETMPPNAGSPNTTQTPSGEKLLEVPAVPIGTVANASATVNNITQNNKTKEVPWKSDVCSYSKGDDENLAKYTEKGGHFEILDENKSQYVLNNDTIYVTGCDGGFNRSQALAAILTGHKFTVEEILAAGHTFVHPLSEVQESFSTEDVSQDTDNFNEVFKVTRRWPLGMDNEEQLSTYDDDEGMQDAIEEKRTFYRDWFGKKRDSKIVFFCFGRCSSAVVRQLADNAELTDLDNYTVVYIPFRDNMRYDRKRDDDRVVRTRYLIFKERLKALFDFETNASHVTTTARTTTTQSDTTATTTSTSSIGAENALSEQEDTTPEENLFTYAYYGANFNPHNPTNNEPENRGSYLDIDGVAKLFEENGEAPPLPPRFPPLPERKTTAITNNNTVFPNVPTITLSNSPQASHEEVKQKIEEDLRKTEEQSAVIKKEIQTDLNQAVSVETVTNPDSDSIPLSFALLPPENQPINLPTDEIENKGGNDSSISPMFADMKADKPIFIPSENTGIKVSQIVNKKKERLGEDAASLKQEIDQAILKNNFAMHDSQIEEEERDDVQDDFYLNCILNAPKKPEIKQFGQEGAKEISSKPEWQSDRLGSSIVESSVREDEFDPAQIELGHSISDYSDKSSEVVEQKNLTKPATVPNNSNELPKRKLGENVGRLAEQFLGNNGNAKQATRAKLS